MAEGPIDFGILAGAGAPVKEFKTGDIIFRQGDAATEFYVVQSGKVDIRLGNRLLGTVGDRDIFGEMALIDAAPRSATAVAATDVRLVAVGEKQFLFMVSQTPHFALNVMRTLARRLRASSAAENMVRRSSSVGVSSIAIPLNSQTSVDGRGPVVKRRCRPKA